MGMVKLTDTRTIPCQYPKFNLKGVHPDWEMHPSWISGIEALNAYNLWVCEVVVPIAFMYISEHKDQIYPKVDPTKSGAHMGDVGVLIAAAFDHVKQSETYKRWLEASKEYEAKVADGTWDPSQTNPVWTAIVKDVRHKTKESFEAKAALLKDTIRL